MNILKSVNRWVSQQPGWVDDTIHTVLGFIVFYLIFALLYWGFSTEFLWGIRVIAFVFPIFIGALEESTNVHPDYKHDLPGYVAGSFIGLIISILFIGT